MAEELGDRVRSEMCASRTNQKRQRALYTRFKSGGVRVKAASYDALKKRQPRPEETVGKRLE